MGGEVSEMRGQTKDDLGKVEEAIANFDAAIHSIQKMLKSTSSEAWPERLFDNLH